MDKEYIIGALTLQLGQLEILAKLTPDPYPHERLLAAQKELASCLGYLRTPIAPPARLVRVPNLDAVTAIPA